METHRAKAQAALLLRGELGLRQRVRGVVDEELQDIIQKPDQVLDHAGVLPVVEVLQVYAGETAHRGAVLVRHQVDLVAQVRAAHLETRFFLRLVEPVVGRVDEVEVRLPGAEPGLQDSVPQIPRADAVAHGVVVRVDQIPDLVVDHGRHKLVGDVDRVVQVEALAVRVAAGRNADVQKLDDVGVGDVQVRGVGSLAGLALPVRGHVSVHRLQERNRAGCDVARRANVRPVPAHAAALDREPAKLRGVIDQPGQAVRDVREKARDRQAARFVARQRRV